MICNRCGFNNVDGSQVCANCNNQLINYNQQYNYVNYNRFKKKKLSFSKKSFICCIFNGFLILELLIYFIYKFDFARNINIIFFAFALYVFFDIVFTYIHRKTISNKKKIGEYLLFPLFSFLAFFIINSIFLCIYNNEGNLFALAEILYGIIFFPVLLFILLLVSIISFFIGKRDI